jgi:hypothetical protein
MENDMYHIKVQLKGIRPMIFDRYAGDNSTQLPIAEKMYLTEKRQLIIPAINILSLLAAENTKSVCRQFFGKNGKTIALGISSYVNITPFEIPITDDSGDIYYTGWNKQIGIHKAVARLPKGIPNPKERPILSLPWYVSFEFEYQDNKYCTLENLRQAITMGGTLGLGSFRPYFGRYELTLFNY